MTNGKGTCEINALASGYAELIERLQARFLIELAGDKFIGAPDEKICKFKEAENFIIQKEMESIGADINLVHKTFYLSNNHSSVIARKKLNEDETIYTPFFSYKTQKLVDLPLFCIYVNQGTNGFAAGNTLEEACVQGLSEIIERYCAREFFLNPINLPTIPKKYYEKYTNLTSMISAIENLGFKLTIKDSSLNKNLPVVCIIFEDIKNPKNGVTIKFGAHPYFPIALERTLTEFLQGFEVFGKNHFKMKFHVNDNNVKNEKIIMENMVNKSFLKKNHPCIIKLLSEEKDYEFNKKTWYFGENISNKAMFNNLCQRILKYSDDIYIRDLSFLGFPTVLIYIPNISYYCVLNQEHFENISKIHEWNLFLNEDKFPQNKTMEELLKLCDFLCEKTSPKIEAVYPFRNIQARYLAFYCSIATSNKKRLRKYLKLILKEQCILKDPNKDNFVLRMYQGFKLYYKLYFANIEETKIKEIIEKKYSEEIYEAIVKSIKNINYNFDSIIDTIKNSPVKEEKNEILIKEIGKKLHQEYLKNTPNQNEIKKIIEKDSTENAKLKKMIIKIKKLFIS